MKKNIVTSFIAFVFGVIAFVLTNNAALLGFVLIVLLAPFVSIGLGRWSAKHTTVVFDTKGSSFANRDLTLEMTVTRPAFFRGRIDFSFEARNVLTGETSTETVSLTPEATQTEHYLLKLDTSCCGRIELSLSQATVNDVLGFASVPLPHTVFSCSYTVYPRVSDINVTLSNSSRIALAGTTYDPHRSGQDKTEVFEMRDYHPGDPMKSIHWKVSARVDNLMVREAARPTDSDIMILVDTRWKGKVEKEQYSLFNAVFSTAASISLALARCGFGHVVAKRSIEGELQPNFVDGVESFNAMMDQTMATSLCSAPFSDLSAFEAYRKKHGVAKTVVVTNYFDEELFDNLSRLCDISVFQVHDQGVSSGVDSNKRYLLTYVAAEDLDTNVKNLEL